MSTSADDSRTTAASRDTGKGATGPGPGTTSEAARAWSDHVRSALERHIEHGQAVCKRVEDGDYDAPSWQRDVVEMTSRVLTDTAESMRLLADLAKAPPRSSQDS